jgi:drug/metabolite transporter (DMT)-like permease
MDVNVGRSALSISLVLLLAITTGLGGVLFGLAYKSLGGFHFTTPYILRWVLNPLVILALVVGIGARVLTYAILSFYNVSEATLLSGLGIVATLVLARLILKDTLTPTELAGSALIVVGSFLIGK